jgi:hypothetical protein
MESSALNALILCSFRQVPQGQVDYRRKPTDLKITLTVLVVRLSLLGIVPSSTFGSITA